jgi:hypothetical protein
MTIIGFSTTPGRQTSISGCSLQLFTDEDVNEGDWDMLSAGILYMLQNDNNNFSTDNASNVSEYALTVIGCLFLNHNRGVLAF